MNKRIREKKEKQKLIKALNELVAESRRQEERRQAAIQRAVDAYMKWYEQYRAQQGD